MNMSFTLWCSEVQVLEYSCFQGFGPQTAPPHMEPNRGEDWTTFDTLQHVTCSYEDRVLRQELRIAEVAENRGDPTSPNPCRTNDLQGSYTTWVSSSVLAVRRNKRTRLLMAHTTGCMITTIILLALRRMVLTPIAHDS